MYRRAASDEFALLSVRVQLEPQGAETHAPKRYRCAEGHLELCAGRLGGDSLGLRRQYRPDQLEVMLKAKALVEANPRLSVFQALQLALGEPPAVATPAVTKGPGGASEALAEALERSLLPEYGRSARRWLGCAQN